MFYIQIIHHHWTKVSRGGVSAQMRNALPQTILSQVRPEGKVATHVIAIQERFDWYEPFDNLAQSHRLIEREKTTSFFRYESNLGFLEFEFSIQNCGAIATRNFNSFDGEILKKSIEIPASGWVQIIANGRFSDMDTGVRWYVQWILNAIQLKTDEAIENPFSRSSLVYSFDGRRYLR